MLTTLDKDIDGRTFRAAQLYSGILPWPCIRDDANDKEAAELFAFEELERRARLAGAAYIRMRLSTPFEQSDDQDRMTRIARAFSYVHTHTPFSTLMIDEVAGLSPQERAHLFYKSTRTNFAKFADRFECKVLEGKDITPELEETFFDLHGKDAGRQVRSRESFAKQADCARHGEGFYTVAVDKKSGKVIGRLLVSLYKGHAIDNSLAVDPEFEGQCVGQFLKLRTISELIARGAKTYELGPREDAPTLMRIATQKDWGLSHFKKGWALGNERMIWELEKFLDADALAGFLQEKENALKTYFKL